MKNLIYILIGLFVLCGTNSYGQLFKKKNGSVSATRKSGTSSGGTKDAFTGKSKKGPNIYSSGSRSKNKSKAYQASTSRKKLRKKNKSVFSSKKRRYKFVNSKPPKEDQGAKSSKGGRKSGKGRKK